LFVFDDTSAVIVASNGVIPVDEKDVRLSYVVCNWPTLIFIDVFVPAPAPDVFDTGAKELEEDPLEAIRGATEADADAEAEAEADADAKLDELLPIFHEAAAELDDPTGAGVLSLYDEEDDIYLIMARIPCTQHTRLPTAMSV
jgi:hypothetical protein